MKNSAQGGGVYIIMGSVDADIVRLCNVCIIPFPEKPFQEDRCLFVGGVIVLEEVFIFGAESLCFQVR